jgi:alginate O-acetyltransferase complex protein AlgI
MIFNTWVFAVFGISVLLLYWGVVPQRFKPHALIVFGTIFYVYSVPAYLLLIVLLGVVTYAIAWGMLRPSVSAATRKRLMILGVVLITGVLVYFKYTKFLALTINQVAAHNIVPLPQIVVPLAISFFTFEFVHVLVDVYLGKIVALDPLDFSVFTMFFPTLVAGPIKRYQSFYPQVRRIEVPPTHTFLLNVYRIAMGVAKKTIIADSMTLLTQPILTPGTPFGTLDYWVALFAYAAKIYFDFTGYSDIAIGVSGLLGIRIPENFEMPYRAPNIAQFWRRWHMSLSSWIRDYVFIPLGGSRVSKAMTAFNLFVAMAISGLWHGAAWTFVLWGLWHGAGFLIQRFWQALVVEKVAFLRDPNPVVFYASVATNFAFVAVGWLLFAAPSVPNAYQAFIHLFG